MKNILIEHFTKEDDILESIKSKSDGILGGVKISDLGNINDVLGGIGKSFVRHFLPEIQKSAIGGARLAEKIYNLEGSPEGPRPTA